MAYRIKLYPAENKDRAKILNNNIFFIAAIFIINKISPSKLMVKGPPKLAIISRNQYVENLGESAILPEFIKYLREWLRSYMVFAP